MFCCAHSLKKKMEGKITIHSWEQQRTNTTGSPAMSGHRCSSRLLGGAHLQGWGWAGAKSPQNECILRLAKALGPDTQQQGHQSGSRGWVLKEELVSCRLWLNIYSGSFKSKPWRHPNQRLAGAAIGKHVLRAALFGAQRSRCLFSSQTLVRRNGAILITFIERLYAAEGNCQKLQEESGEMVHLWISLRKGK